MLKYFSNLIVLMVVFLVGYFVTVEIKRLTYSNKLISYNETSDTQIALVYIGCSTCPFATDKEIPRLVRELDSYLSMQSEFLNYDYTTIGLSNDLNVKEGLDYLFDIFKFNEISLGNGYENTSLQRFMWQYENQVPNISGTPQIIILKRVFNSIDDIAISNKYPSLKTEKILTRKIGLYSITKLIDENFVEIEMLF